MKRHLRMVITLAVVLSLTACGANETEPIEVTAVEEENVDMEERDYKEIKVSLENASTFNEGKFQGWGTSFCWWANRIGYSDVLSEKAAKAMYSEEGLHMNIVRFNIGGGDDPSHNHITRTDSEMPGYWKNPCVVTDDGEVIVAATEPMDEPDRVTVKSGNTEYSWAYDWSKDYNQRNALIKAKEAYGEELIVEAFSNSPPFFMTCSLCSSGAENAGSNNIREDAYEAFARYMADVAAHYRDEWGISFQSITPMNEPFTSYWGAYSEKQEGCHFDQGECQSKIILALHDAMLENGFSDNDIIYSASDETDVSTAIMSYKKLSEESKNVVSRIDTHTYSASALNVLRKMAEDDNKNLWMSETDGGDTLGKDAGEMGAALYFADLIQRDMNGLLPSAWIMWQAIDNHISKDGYNGKKDSGMVNLNKGYWGLTVTDHDKEEIILTKKYYAYGQYSRFITPGALIIGCDNAALAAYDKENRRLVIVDYNYRDEEEYVSYDLSEFDISNASCKMIRTSEDEDWKEEEAFLSENCLKGSLKGYSITTYVIDNVAENE